MGKYLHNLLTTHRDRSLPLTLDEEEFLKKGAIDCLYAFKRNHDYSKFTPDFEKRILLVNQELVDFGKKLKSKRSCSAIAEKIERFDNLFTKTNRAFSLPSTSTAEDVAFVRIRSDSCSCRLIQKK